MTARPARAARPGFPVRPPGGLARPARPSRGISPRNDGLVPRDPAGIRGDGDEEELRTGDFARRVLVGVDLQAAFAQPAHARTQVGQRLRPAAPAELRGAGDDVRLYDLAAFPPVRPDRVRPHLLAEGRPQEFGTQASGEIGRWVPRLLRDPDNVDQRRAAVPLERLAEYLARMSEHSGPPQPAVLTCPQCSRPMEFSMPEHGQGVTADCPGCGRTIEITAIT
jgi:hypothetical protein